MSLLCAHSHCVGCRLPCRRRMSFSSNVKLRQMLSWKKPPRRRCSDNSSRCFTQLLLCHDNTSGSVREKQVSVKAHQRTEQCAGQQQRLQRCTFTLRLLVRFHTLVLPMIRVTVLCFFGLLESSSSPNGTETSFLGHRCKDLKSCACLLFSTF